MFPEITNEKSLEDFRKATYDALIEKGIKPPKLGSKEEQNLFGQWLRGSNTLQSNE